MSYTIEYLEPVIKVDIPKLPKRARALIATSIAKRLTTHPDLYGVPLRRALYGLRKLRVSEYRVVFQIAGKTVTIIMIDYRKNIYQRIFERLQYMAF